MAEGLGAGSKEAALAALAAELERKGDKKTDSQTEGVMLTSTSQGGLLRLGVSTRQSSQLHSLSDPFQGPSVGPGGGSS